MTHLRSRKHVFFDLDDTLWDFEGNSSVVLQDLFREFELNRKLGVDFGDFYTSYKAVNAGLWARYYQREIDKAYLRNHRFNLAFNRFGYDNYEENLLITAHYLERAPKGRLLKDGCLEMLNYLKERYTLHLITNGFKEVQAIKIDNCQLRGYFSAIIISEEHNLTKPDEKVFRLAESMAGATQEQCVMIGDNFECDVKGALNAGWEAVHFSGTSAPGFTGYSISSLKEIRSLF